MIDFELTATQEQLIAQTEAFIRDMIIPLEQPGEPARIDDDTRRELNRLADMDGGLGFIDDTVVAQIASEIRGFRIYDGPSEVHRWSIARQLKQR